MIVEFIRKGTEIIESCLDKCERVHVSVNFFQPNQEVMDMLLAKDYLKVHFNSAKPDDDILHFHNSKMNTHTTVILDSRAFSLKYQKYLKR